MTERHIDDEHDEELRIPSVEERLILNKETVETGRVRVSSRVESDERLIRETLKHENVRIERVPADRLTQEPPAVREEAGRLVLPVYEEVMVKQFRVTEEVHVITEHSEEVAEGTVRLRSNRVDVERTDPKD